ncbi:UDP-N-acetylmuramoyl-tripeptide--D-alanyl-D-alanine ligase [Carboxylicivirga mesophila]|uniref:UDP-N-acetylmuramoyl-tripeptide--D-alanyl-D-alanine ligase n=1 Tax=Carboxylicivirga mesophila TaxID=1166478 RepID=A0ABS5KEW6_9BACT|nr:UDP-N-acetylmuramoyl-tripeptide--D-alanyl-D-alanine ligase [Carboxylicivirga mesophila]MBS2213545.1 UDP-N-acetylmuramoyl-tripeptide--D-alanyl-D-alanine ligase [Carboxylicivirga mesophila]
MSQIANIHQAFLASKGVSTDSRSNNKGFMFFALKGANFDGNKYVDSVMKDEAAFAVADDETLSGLTNVFIVEDVLTTLQELARFHRRYLNIPILAITGSNGKTTTKELVAAVLKEKYTIKATSGNYNNHIGVPLTLLSMDESIEFGVVEMGANHIGEIEALCKIAEPNYGIITNVGKAHLEGFGSFEGVKTAKGELYQYLKHTNGIVFINADNPHLDQMAAGLSNRIDYGPNHGKITGQITADYPFVAIKWHSGQTNKSYDISTQLIGAYNLENILSAICIGYALGVNETAINKALQAYSPSNNRSQFIQTENNQIIMDAYNANPSSMQVALQNFGRVDAENKILIIGGMKELGSDSLSEHSKLIDTIKELKLSQVMLIGEEFHNLANDNKEFSFFATTDELIDSLKASRIKNAYFLIKGSRSNKLEEVLPYL